jgi:hypothetical protein
VKIEATKCGRPLLPIDGERVRELAGRAFTNRDIAAALQCDRRTIERRFAPEIEQGRALARARVWEAMFEAAVVNKNVRALKFEMVVLCGISDR